MDTSLAMFTGATFKTIGALDGSAENGSPLGPNAFINDGDKASVADDGVPPHNGDAVGVIVAAVEVCCRYL
jgi:hypothetical protein